MKDYLEGPSFAGFTECLYQKGENKLNTIKYSDEGDRD
jgi:hypothetical protein